MGRKLSEFYLKPANLKTSQVKCDDKINNKALLQKFCCEIPIKT